MKTTTRAMLLTFVITPAIMFVPLAMAQNISPEEAVRFQEVLMSAQKIVEQMKAQVNAPVAPTPIPATSATTANQLDPQNAALLAQALGGLKTVLTQLQTQLQDPTTPPATKL